MSVNKVILLGRLGSDPELKQIPGGSEVCNFNLATSEEWTDKQGKKQERTEWSPIVVYGKLAVLCNQYLSKGRQAYVEGKLQTKSWDDKKTGQKRYKTEINCHTVQFIGGKAEANTSHQKPKADPFQTASTIINKTDTLTVDDLPF